MNNIQVIGDDWGLIKLLPKENLENLTEYPPVSGGRVFQFTSISVPLSNRAISLEGLARVVEPNLVKADEVQTCEGMTSPWEDLPKDTYFGFCVENTGLYGKLKNGIIEVLCLTEDLPDDNLNKEKLIRALCDLGNAYQLILKYYITPPVGLQNANEVKTMIDSDYQILLTNQRNYQ